MYMSYIKYVEKICNAHYKKIMWLHNTELLDNREDTAGDWEMFVDLVFWFNKWVREQRHLCFPIQFYIYIIPTRDNMFLASLCI